jgi:hypothetical protein
MNYRATILTIGNAGLFLGFCALAGTGLLLELRLDEESGARRLLGLDRDEWGEIHFVVALTFVGLAVLHSVLNWGWIKTAMKQRRVGFLVLAAGAMCVLTLLMWPSGPSEGPGNPQTRQHSDADD